MRSLLRFRPSNRRPAVPALRSALVPVFLAGALGVPAALAAQGRPVGDTTGRSRAAADTAAFRLVGQVRDLSTRFPVPMAVVELPGRDLLRVADDSGYFAFEGLRPGSYPLVAQAVGYASTFDTITVHAGQGALVWLKPRPVLLPEVGVVVRRQSFVARLNETVNATGYNASVIGPDELARSPLGDLATVLEARSVAHFAPCPDQSPGDAPACMRYRGRTVRVRVLYNDGPAPADLMLSESPRDFYDVQFIPGLRLVRLYTYDYIEALAARGWKPRPICTVCDR